MTVIDVAVLLQVFVAKVSDGQGMRIATLTRILEAPRSTITDSLSRLVAAGLLVRDDRRLYYPAQDLADHANQVWADVSKNAIRLAEKVETYVEDKEKKSR